MSQNIFPYLVIIFVAFAGFFLAFYLHHKKKTKEAFVCPLRARCDTVMHSDFSKFLGIPVELLGLGYYAFVAVSYAVLAARPELASSTLLLAVFTASTGAFFFSLYLTFIQAFALKQWCSWCLVSASFCTIIFFVAVSGSHYSLGTLFTENQGLILALHGLGVALGVGGATITDLFFFKFLKDFRISEWEADVLRTLSQVIWFALALLVITGLGLYFPHAAEFNVAPRFLVKAIVVAVIVINGACLNLLVAPHLVKISFGKKHEHEAGELHRTRKLGFALGAISIVSWYAAFVLGSLRMLDWTFWQFLGVYIVLLVLAITASRLMDQSLDRRARRP